MGLFEAFYNDDTAKRLYIIHENQRIPNDLIVSGSTKLSESLCSGEDLTFGSAEASLFDFKLFKNLTGLKKGDRIQLRLFGSVEKKSYEYLIPVRYKNLTKRTFDEEEFTKKSFDDVGFTKDTFDSGMKSLIFKSLLPLTTETVETDKYFVVNNVLPYIQYYSYDGQHYEVLNEPEQPKQQIKNIVFQDGVLCCYHLDADFATVYKFENDTLIKQPDKMLNELEKEIARRNNYNAFYGEDVYFEVLRTDAFVFDGINLGTFNIDEANRLDSFVTEFKSSNDMIKFDTDVTDWYEKQAYPISLRNFIISLCSYVGIGCDIPNVFLNSDMPVKKTFQGKVSGRQVLKWVGEASGTFPHVDRDDVLRLRTLNLFPSLKVPWYFPGSKVADYPTSFIDKLQIKSEEDDVGIVIGTGTNAYVVQGNPLFYTETDSEIRPYAEKLFDYIKTVSFLPYSLELRGNPLLEVGSTYYTTYKEKTLNALILKRTLTGISSMGDKIEANGKTTREANESFNSMIQQTYGRMNKIVHTVEENSSEIKNLSENVSSKFQQLDNEISLKVESEEVEQMLKVSLEGVVFESNLTDGRTVISGSNIKTGSINADLIKTGTIDAIDIYGSTITGAQIEGSTIQFGTSSNYGKLYSEENGSVVIEGTKFVRIDAGTRGLQIDSPTAINDSLGVVYDCDISGDLIVVGTSTFLGGVEFDDIEASDLYLSNSLYLDGEEIYYSSSSGGFWFGDSVCPNTTRGYYDLGTDGYRWGSVYLEYDPDVSSDIRLKENIKEFDLANIIDEVKIYEFVYKNDERKKKRVGILANAESLLNKHSSYFINEPRVLLDNDGKAEETFYSSNPHNLFYANIKATQEARAEIRKMKEELEILKKEIAELKKEKGEVQ